MTTPNIYRSRILNEISESDVGKTIRVAGWVENIRDHGGVSFIDLRDMYAVLQVVIRDPELLKGIKKEECISIEGVVEQRDEETYNPKIPYRNYRTRSTEALRYARTRFTQPASF